MEIEKFGKDQLGSYPIHFHKVGDVAAGTLLINSNSIHHSYNKCVTIHSTQQRDDHEQRLRAHRRATSSTRRWATSTTSRTRATSASAR